MAFETKHYSPMNNMHSDGGGISFQWGRYIHSDWGGIFIPMEGYIYLDGGGVLYHMGEVYPFRWRRYLHSERGSSACSGMLDHN